jgi:NADH:ubiquinone oxidoreductase subunit E
MASTHSISVAAIPHVGCAFTVGACSAAPIIVVFRRAVNSKLTFERARVRDEVSLRGPLRHQLTLRS